MYETNKVADAIMWGKFDEARELLKAGETLSGNHVQNNKRQIFTCILRGKAFDLIDVLIENGLIETDVYEYDDFDKSFFKTIAAELTNDDDSINFFKNFLEKIQNKNDEVKDQTLLGYCLTAGADPIVIKCLIDAGCDVNYKNNSEGNFIHLVVRENMLNKQRGAAYINLLISEGVNINDKDIIAESPLMIATKGHQKEYMEILLQNGADANEQDKDGNSPFFIAIVYQQDLEIYRLLKEYATPDFDIANKNGDYMFPLYIKGLGYSDFVLLKEMLNDGADLYQSCLEYSVQKSGIDWIAEKPAELLKAVLSTDAISVNKQDDAGNTILHKVCAFDVRYEPESAREIYQKVKLLLAAGADAQITNDKDQTVLMLAQTDNLKIKTVELLMQQKL